MTYHRYDYAITPTSLWRYLGIGDESNIECGRFLPRTNYPQFKIPNRQKRVLLLLTVSVASGFLKGSLCKKKKRRE
jgi:hypothetical protein